MMTMLNAVIFDFIGTLATVEEYSFEKSEKKLYESLETVGFKMDYTRFVDAYEKAHQKYRTIRYEKLVEVTNAVWVSEALNTLGYQTTPEDKNITAAINFFFEDYIASLKLRQNAKKVLEKLSPNHALGLVSNFTYAPVIHTGLRKLGIRHYFNHVVVSQDFGWRKPSVKIFREILGKLRAVGKEAAYVGDSPLEDIKGAQNVGMKTIFIPSQFYGLTDLEKAAVRPDFIVKDLNEVLSVVSKF